MLDNNLPLVRRLCVGSASVVMHQELNEIDYNGFTPLMLAQQLHRFDALRVLCDAYCNPKFRPFPFCKLAYSHLADPTPYELALMEKDREVLKIYVQAN